MSVTEFKAHCLELLNDVAKTGEPLLLTKRGKPTALVSAPPAKEGQALILGKFRDQAKIVGDLLAPYDEPWEANR